MKMMNPRGGYSSSAKVIGDTLVLSLPDAISPVVWRMELGEIKAAAFEVRENGDTHLLVMKTPKGDAQEIAPYDTKTKALKALMEASRAMEHAAADIRNIAYANDTGRPAVMAASAPPKGKGHLVAVAIAVLILGGLVFGLSQAGPGKHSLTPAGIAATETAAGGSTQNTADAPGVPVSADDFLRNR